MPLVFRDRQDLTASGDAVPPVGPDAAKTRRCLRCRTGFQSGWSGERICTRCKQTVGWRSSAPTRS